jgi:hypothetical protein
MISQLVCYCHKIRYEHFTLQKKTRKQPTTTNNIKLKPTKSNVEYQHKN